MTTATTRPARTAAEVRERPWRMLIGGELVEAAGGRYPVQNPTDEQLLAEAPDATAADVDAAQRAAAAAGPAWAARPPRERAAILRRLAAAVLEHREELATLDALDLGSPLPSMRLDIDRAVESLELFADMALALTGSVIPASAEHLHYTLRQPWGVVGRILPFNHPLMFAAGK